MRKDAACERSVVVQEYHRRKAAMGIQIPIRLTEEQVVGIHASALRRAGFEPKY